VLDRSFAQALARAIRSIESKGPLLWVRTELYISTVPAIHATMSKVWCPCNLVARGGDDPHILMRADELQNGREFRSESAARVRGIAAAVSEGDSMSLPYGIHRFGARWWGAREEKQVSNRCDQRGR
jgi:hypothetical protein